MNEFRQVTILSQTVEAKKMYLNKGIGPLILFFVDDDCVFLMCKVMWPDIWLPHLSTCMKRKCKPLDPQQNSTTATGLELKTRDHVSIHCTTNRDTRFLNTL